MVLIFPVGASPGGFPNADLEWVEVMDDYTPLVDATVSLYPKHLVSNRVEWVGNPPTQTLNIISDGLLNWNQTDDATWLDVTPESGATPSTLTLAVNTTGLLPGIYSGIVTVSAAGAINSPQSAQITLIVNRNVPVKVST